MGFLTRKRDPILSRHGLGRSTVDDRLYAVTIWIDCEAGVIVGAVVRPRAWTSVVAASVQECLSMKLVHGVSVWRGERQMKTMTGGYRRRTGLLNAELVALPFEAVADGLTIFSGTQVFKNPYVSQLLQCVVIELGSALDVGYCKGDVMKHVHDFGNPKCARQSMALDLYRGCGG